jgi:hypothetical protein
MLYKNLCGGGDEIDLEDDKSDEGCEIELQLSASCNQVARNLRISSESCSGPAADLVNCIKVIEKLMLMPLLFPVLQATGHSNAMKV